MENNKNSLSLYVDPASFSIVQSKSKNIMVIDKIKRNVEVKENAQFKSKSQPIHILGVLGLIEAPSTSYLILIMRTSSVGFIEGAEILKIEELKFLPCVNSLTVVGNDQTFISMFTSFLLRNALYYSDAYDLTNSSKKYFNLLMSSSTFENYSILKNLNQNYCWNYSLLKQFLATPSSDEFVKPIINGFIGINFIKADVGENGFHYILISRRDRRRSGVRYIVRGNDENGNSANFVETEQIITFRPNKESELTVMSYYIIRGSVPLIWSQKRDLTYNPIVFL